MAAFCMLLTCEGGSRQGVEAVIQLSCCLGLASELCTIRTSTQMVGKHELLYFLLLSEISNSDNQPA